MKERRSGKTETAIANSKHKAQHYTSRVCFSLNVSFAKNIFLLHAKTFPPLLRCFNSLKAAVVFSVERGQVFPCAGHGQFHLALQEINRWPMLASSATCMTLLGKH